MNEKSRGSSQGDILVASVCVWVYAQSQHHPAHSRHFTNILWIELNAKRNLTKEAVTERNAHMTPGIILCFLFISQMIVWLVQTPFWAFYTHWLTHPYNSPVRLQVRKPRPRPHSQEVAAGDSNPHHLAQGPRPNLQAFVWEFAPKLKTRDWEFKFSNLLKGSSYQPCGAFSLGWGV